MSRRSRKPLSRARAGVHADLQRRHVEHQVGEHHAEQAADVAKMCREKRREIETWRDALVRPLNQAVKQVNAVLKKQHQGRLEKEERRLKNAAAPPQGPGKTTSLGSHPAT